MNTAPFEQPVKGCIYLRLSKDDESAGESASISNQRKILLHYAKEHRLSVEKEFCDDGCSGTTFDRPGFKEMIAAVERKEINLILTKDLSRLGRDYILTGQYTELYFPSRKVRFIAVGDGYDSAVSATDMLPFRNIVNEMYARDISRKIKASLQIKMREGAFIGNFPPYGYQKDPLDRHHLIPDTAVAPVVKRIFLEASRGLLPSHIAAQLNEAQIPSPALYRCVQHPGLTPEHYTVHGLWTANTIIKMLHNPVYLGHMVQGKTQKISFKSSLTVAVPASQRAMVRDTHEALVSQKVFHVCEKQLAKRACRKKSSD